MEKGGGKKLGTFLGVYTPTILTIFGVIMYMRAGELVGKMGLWPMVFIVLISNSITLITTLSFSSIATNKKVGVGGAYYIVSRSLGFEIGGAVGLPLFLSQALSITLYSFGLAEVIKMLFETQFSLNLVTFGIIAVVAAVSFVGAGFAMKTQIPVMIFVAVSILFLIIGAFMKGSFIECFRTFPSNFGDIFASHEELSFFSAMAIFFPAVSGIMAGLGLSGDLENPQKSIPIGAIAATLTGFAFYVTLPLFLSMGATPEEMLKDRMIWSRISVVGERLFLTGFFKKVEADPVEFSLDFVRSLFLVKKSSDLSDFRKIAFKPEVCVVPVFEDEFDRVRIAFQVLVEVGSVFQHSESRNNRVNRHHVRAVACKERVFVRSHPVVVAGVKLFDFRVSLFVRLRRLKEILDKFGIPVGCVVSRGIDEKFKLFRLGHAGAEKVCFFSLFGGKP